jgi:hypothetical protein
MSTIIKFNLQYQSGPVLFNRTLPSITTTESFRSFDPTCSIDAAGACDEANQLVGYLQRFLRRKIPDHHYNNAPSIVELSNLIVTLSRGTFLSKKSVRFSKSKPLVEIIHQHIPIHEIDNIIYEYLDSGAHGII